MSLTTLNIPIGPYMALAAEEELLRKAEKVGKRQRGKKITAIFSDELYAYDWIPNLHDAVADQAIKDLVDSNIMKKRKDIFRYKLSIYHISGGIKTPSGVFQVVIPTVKPDQPSRIRITPQDTRVQVPVEWSFGSYFLLSEGTMLSPTTPISYISISIPLVSRISDS
ncbi:hypothetical protein M441DRAFT_70195 [Trichoderma asperellum CBS 433.97]|uniref:Uncharacterized protein n=1 Tax=Trichoderma asperellum (strain ATCC 204424 / CBS 433.97 / NBRC 101777) TaxID=1042311 RepID=A0A2T3Z6E7_TRIA4|nr:hypothetical protein M441DRAFT_70195 [Trichoderma asperellum CBS 433.97]PTB40383.1 hypothetical protein M441DRAFT_70195 [Trichoderma asperellum CBS 433.97]